MRRFVTISVAFVVTGLLPAAPMAAPASPKHDCRSTSGIEAGPAPAVSLLEVDYGAFRYPRTLPLKASATDTDLLTVQCEACDGSESRIPVVDDVHPGDDPRSGYRWVLTGGPGSLNAPYDARAITEAEDDLDTARTALERFQRASREAEALVAVTQKEVTRLESAREKYAGRLDRARERVEALDAQIAAILKREEAAATLLAGPEARLVTLRSQASEALNREFDQMLVGAEVSPATADFVKHRTEQDKIDEQIARLKARLFQLESHVPRASNPLQVEALTTQLAQLTTHQHTRHEVTCQFATEAVPLLLTLGSAHRGAVGLSETLAAVRHFLGLCDPGRVPGYEEMVSALPRMVEVCDLLALGIPSPTPVELEMLPTCGALHHEQQVLDEMRALHRRLDATKNAGAIEHPRREMKAIRARLRALHEERAEARDAVAVAQRAILDATAGPRLVSDEARARRDALDAEIGSLAGATAAARSTIRSIRDLRRRHQDERVEASARWHRAEARVRQAQADLNSAWERSQEAVQEARALSGEIATAEARVKNAEKAFATGLAALEPGEAATGQIAWYSPPPLQRLLADNPAARQQLQAAREVSRKASAELEELQHTLRDHGEDQLERLETIFGAVGGFKALLVEQRQLEQRRSQLSEAIRQRADLLAEAAEVRRERVRVASSALREVRGASAFGALVKAYEGLRRDREAVVAAVTTARSAVDPVFAAYREQLRRLQKVQGERVDKVVEMKATVASSLQFRAKAFESRRTISLQGTFDRLLAALLVGAAERVGADADKGYREAIAEHIEAARAAIRSDEQAAEDTKALVAAQLAELQDLTEREGRIRRSLAEARVAYDTARLGWKTAADDLDDHDARIVSTRQAISERWTEARSGVMDLHRLLGGDDTAPDGRHGYLLDAALRDARLAVPEAVASFRAEVISHVHAFKGAALIVDPESLATVDPVVARVRDRLHEVGQLARDRRKAIEAFPGSTLAALHGELDAVEERLDDHAKARASAATHLDGALREARARRDRASGTALSDARAKAAAALEQYENRRDEITRRLVAALSVTLSLEATDRGKAAGRADDPPAQTTVKLTFAETLEARVSAPAARSARVEPKQRLKGTCEPTLTSAAGGRHAWVQSPSLPSAIFAGEALGVSAIAADLDRLTPVCEAGEPGCQRAGRVAPLVVEEFHPTTWTVSNAKGFLGGAGRLEGGQTTPAGVFVAPAPGELLKATDQDGPGAPVCAKPVIVSVLSMADGDMASESAPAPKQARVLVRAGVIAPPAEPIQALAGQPVDVSFRLYKVAEDGVPLPGNVAFEEGIDGQEVQLTVERLSGDASPKAWGFDGSKRTIKSVSRRGLVSESLTLSPTPGRYRVTANWREGAACQASVDVITPVHIASRVLYAPSHAAWDAAVLDLVTRGRTSEAELTKLVKGVISSTASVDLEDDWSGSEELGDNELSVTRAAFDAALHSWTLLSDRDHKPLRARQIHVTPTGAGVQARAVGSVAGAQVPNSRQDASVASVNSDTLGLARARLSARGVPDGSYPALKQSGAVRVELADEAAKTYQLSPYPVTAAWSPNGAVQRAWIGPHDQAGAASDRFLLELDRSAVPGRTVQGTATLVAPLFRSDEGLASVTLRGAVLNGVVLDADGVVKRGQVVFDARKSATDTSAEAGCSRLGGGATLCIRHLTIPAGGDALVTGVVSLPLSAHRGQHDHVGPLRFSGRWTPGDGAVLALLDALPALNVVADGSASIEGGASATLDLSHRSSPPDLPATWKGLVVHQSRLALQPLRAHNTPGAASPVVRMPKTAWSWPFTAGRTVGHVDRRGMAIRLPGLVDAEIRDAALDLRQGALTVRRGTLSFALPGSQDPIAGYLSVVDGAWALDLQTSSPVRVGEWATLALRPGARGALGSDGLSRLEGELQVRVPGLSSLRLTGLAHDPSTTELRVKASDLEAPGQFVDRFPFAATGAVFEARPAAEPTGLPIATLRVDGAFAFPSAPPASGHVSLTVGDDGVDIGAKLQAAPHFAGVSWTGAMAYDGTDFTGSLSGGEASRAGLGRVTTPALEASMAVAAGTPAYQTLRGVGPVVRPKDLSLESVAFFDTPYVAVDGELRVGWHHTPPDADFIGYAQHREGSPLSTHGELTLSDRGGGATLGAQVDMVYQQGRDPEAVVDGVWTYFDRPGIVFGHGHARIRKRGHAEGHVDLQLDIDTPSGELLHATTPVDFVARGAGVRVASGRFEGLMAQGAIPAAGDVHLVVDAPAKRAELALTAQMKLRGDWDWPTDDSVGTLQVDLVNEGTLPVVFTGGEEKGGTFTLAAAETAWRGTVSGPLDLGFNTVLLGSTTASGSSMACFPHLCTRGQLVVPSSYLGFLFDMGQAWFEFGTCTRGCDR